MSRAPLLSAKAIQSILATVMRGRISSRKRIQLAGRVLLVAALLIAHGGAVVHAYSHLANDPPSLPTQTCAKCLSFSSLHNVVGGSDSPPLIERRQVGDVIPSTSFAVVSVSRPSPFRSRAPPALL